MADSKGLLKIALLGGVGYWAYTRYFAAAPAASGGFTEQVPVGTAPGVPLPSPPANVPNAVPVVPAPVVTPATSVPVVPTNPQAINGALLNTWQASGVDPELLLGGAASIKSKAGDSGQYRLNWHQWNYYRTLYTAANNLALPNYAPQDVGEGDGSKLYTAAEFQAVLSAKGEPYSSGLGGIVPVNSNWLVGGRPLSTAPVFPGVRFARGR